MRLNYSTNYFTKNLGKLNQRTVEKNNTLPDYTHYLGKSKISFCFSNKLNRMDDRLLLPRDIEVSLQGNSVLINFNIFYMKATVGA